jgi:hypothetical protein
MYVDCGVSWRSDWILSLKPAQYLEILGVVPKSMRLFKNFSSWKVIRMFDGSVFLIPKRTITSIWCLSAYFN